MSSQNEVNGSLKELDGMYSKQDREIKIASEKPKWKSLTGGLLLILSVCLSIIFAIDFSTTTHVKLMCNPMVFFFLIFALIGGISALLKRRWIFSILGGLFGLFLGGPYMLSSGISARQGSNGLASSFRNHIRGTTTRIS